MHYGLFNGLKKELTSVIAETNNIYPLELRLAHATEGSIKFTDAYILKRILNKYKPRTILEVGSFLGFSTRWMLEVTKNWNAKITAVDPNIRHRVFDDPHSILMQYNSRFFPDRLEIVRGFFGCYDNDNIYYDYENYEPKNERSQVNEILKQRPIIDKSWDRKFDFIFIDGDHSYTSVMNNFGTSIGLLNKSGVISFHDALSWMGVNRAIKELKANYSGRAEVDIYGSLDKRIFSPLNVHIDGVGLFRLLC